MRLAFLVNDVDTEVDEYATTRLARAAARGGHETWYVGVGDLELGSSDGLFAAMARAARWKSDDTLASFMEGIKARDAERIVMDDLDALVLRNESIDDLQERPWASPMGVVFGQMLADRGVTVVNDPNTLHRATSKLYLEEFPEKVRPRSLVTRDPEAIERFVDEVGHSVVKPLYGAKGRNVFMIEGPGETNLAQMTEAVLQDGYAIVQEFIDGAKDGDARSSCWRAASSSATAGRPPSDACPPATTRARTSAPAVGRCPSRSVRPSSASSRRWATSSSPMACSSWAST